MYSFLGSIIFAFLFGSKGVKASPLPSFKGIIEVRHFLPGRIRFVIPRVAGGGFDLEAVKAQLLSIQGIQGAELSPVSGSAVILYRKDIMEPLVVFAIMVKLFGLEKDIEKIPQPVLARELQNFNEALNRSLYENTAGILDLRTSIPLVLAILGVYKLAAGKEPLLPGGVTLLWWAYNSLLNRGDQVK